MRRKHHRRFTCLAILARSLTAPRAAAGLLLALAALLVITPAQGNAQSATYRVTFEGKFTASALASGASVPSGEHFTTLIGAVHNDSATFWSSGAMASAGVEGVAELGTTGTFKSEIKANMNAVAVIEKSLPSGGTPTATVDFTVTTAHPLVTLLTMIAPSPDWFVGVSGLSLLDAQGDWLASHTVDLFPYDAGTEEGTEFSLSNAAASPQGTITSIKGTGKFSNEPIATLTFTLQEAAPEITSATTFPVDEGTTAVETLDATDQDSAVADLEWSKAGGADAGQFMLSTAGVLAFAAAPDYENPDDADGDRTYEITVQVSDGDNTDTADIRVTLQNVVELLTELTGPSSTDYAENGAVRVATYTASSEADRDGIAWSLGGDDAEHFSIDNPLGVLRFHIDPVDPSLFLQPPDFEAPVNDDDDNVYEVIVLAQAGSALTLKSVIVTVTDVDEGGTLTLSSSRPRLGTALTATLSDPDTVSGTVEWKWERSAGRNAWTVIDGAASSIYTPTADDGGNYLRVTASYTDRHPSGKEVQAVAPNVVLAHTLSRLEVTTSSSRSMYPAFDSEILHYAVGCQDTLTLTLSTGETDTRLAVNGIQRANQNVVVELMGLAGGSDIPITLTGSEGASTTYVLHCLADDFPAIITEKKPGAWDGLITIGVRAPLQAPVGSYLAIIDNNGVPRIHWRIDERVRIFRTHRDGRYPYSYGQAHSRNVIVLDENLEPVDKVTTVRPLHDTDLHDFVVKSNGNYLLMAYESARRDMSQFLNSDGDPYSTTELTRDSVIQEVTPDKEESFNWNSWDHMAIEDCTQHRFPDDYAHVNSLQAVHDDIVASFRGCSKVLRIDGDSGDVIWRLGKSNRSDADWTASGTQPPLRIVGDPYGEFCGQHSARMIDNGNLLLFDNGVACLVDSEGNRTRPGEDFTRVVEYAIDPDHGEAIFQRHYSYHGEFNKLAQSQGHIEPLETGNWLISWGSMPVSEKVTELNPLTGEEVLIIKLHELGDSDSGLRTTAYPVSPVALAKQVAPLAAEIAESPASSAFHLGPTDAPKVVVTFNQPVVDLTAATPSVNVRGATVESVSPHTAPGEPANAYLFTLTPAGVGPITFALVTGQSCASGGICTADETVLTEVRAPHVIPPRTTGPVVASITSSATHPTKDGFTVTITFSELVMGLTANEIEVTNGTGSNFAGAGGVYTLEITPNTGIEDHVTVTVTAGAVVDGVNNGNLEASEAFSVDTKAPTVSSVEISSDSGTDATYAAGDEIRITVTFSETVVVTGTPQLRLKVGSEDRTANYQGGAGSALVFGYQVAAGESDTEGVSVEANPLSLNGGTIKDGSENVAVLDHAGLAADAGHKVEAIKPELLSAVVNEDELKLTYNETVDGSSTPEAGDFTVSGGDHARTVSRVSVSGSTVLLTLDVGAEHLEAGIRVSYTPGTNRIRDVAGNEAEALSRVPVSNETPDTTAPGVISLAISSNPGSDQAYAAEDVIEVTVSFSETVEVTGTPQLRLRVGSSNRTAGYLRGTDTEELVFGYEVADGREDTDGVSIEAGRITLNGGTIKDEADNPAELAHEAVAAQVGHKVDGVRPVFVSAAVDGSSLTLTYGETLDGGSRPAPGDFTVEVDGAGRSVTGVSVSGSVVTLTLNTAVEHGDTGIRVSYTPGTNPIQDAVGNDARGLSNQAVTNTTGAPNTAPEITTVGPFTVRENQALVRRLAARDDDSGDEVTGWSIVGGADGSQFSITSDTGDLSFQEAPDYESPTDVVSGDPPSGAGDNEYVVTVEVRSGAGARELEAEQTFTVRVTDEREPPGIPEAPAFSGETADSLTVHWRDPENTGPAITDYDVRYRKKGPGRFTDAQHMGPGLSLTLDDLEPGTAYEVQVQATNDEGTSDWSDPGEGMTVTPLTVEMMGGTEPPVEGPFTVRFSFSEPVRGFTQAAIETAQDPACTDEQNNPVFCEPDIGRLETVDDRVFNTTVTPQTDRVAHNYTLTLTVSGGAVRSSVGNKRNEEAMLGGRVAPPGVTVPISEIGLTASGLDRVGRLNWNRPANDGGSPIIRYEYRYAPVGEVWNDWENVGAGAAGVTVGNLVNGLEYVFEVRAVNALGKGPVETAAVTPVLRTGPPPPPPPPPPPGPRKAVPDAPTNLLADGGNEQVALSWETPENDGGFAITDYEVRINGRGSWRSTGSIHTTHTVTGLTNGTAYVFQVRAVNAAGRSPYSNRAEATPGVGALDFAHFANGAGIISDLVFVNVATHPIRPVLYFYGQEGHLIDPESMVDLTGDLEVTEDGALSIWTEMEPLGELTISTHGRGELVSGSVKVAANGPIGGVLRFDLPGIGVAGVGASQPVRDALFPARRQAGGISTAAAIHNIEEEAIVVSCRLMSGGVVLEEMEISLAANGQEAQFIEEMFTTTDTSNFVGLVRCTGPGRCTGVAVELDAASRIFTTLPVVPVNLRGRGREAVLDFAHFANGEGITSDLVFVNVETQPSGPAPTPFHTAIPPIRPALYFYDKEGNPIAAESVVEITGDLEVRADGGLSVRTEMEPLGELTISTHGQGELVSGSVRVVSEGPIGGVLRFDLPGIGVAGVGASQPVRDALFPARREGDLSTAAAIRNLGEEAIEVSCQLMSGGIVLEEAEIPLEANGQEARYIEELFPRTDTSDFVGSVRCTAPGEGAFTGVAVELDASNQIFTTLPVVPVPERMSQE